MKTRVERLQRLDAVDVDEDWRVVGAGLGQAEQLQQSMAFFATTEPAAKPTHGGRAEPQAARPRRAAAATAGSGGNFRPY